jgi:predicted  nucleic acid-binding Zn-ribbon protein
MTRARDEAQTRLEDARQALEVREVEYDAYRQKWDDLESRLNEAREALEALKGEETDAS